MCRFLQPQEVPEDFSGGTVLGVSLPVPLVISTSIPLWLSSVYGLISACRGSAMPGTANIPLVT